MPISQEVLNQRLAAMSAEQREAFIRQAIAAQAKQKVRNDLNKDKAAEQRAITRELQKMLMASVPEEVLATIRAEAEAEARAALTAKAGS